MEVWTFINTKTNQIIRVNTRLCDIEFGQEYYFTEFEHAPLWFVNTKEEAETAYKEGFVHPQYSIHYSRPVTETIDINQYKIVKFNIDEKNR